ncbi:copper transporter [Cellulomonas sp. PhB143]|uniref:copper transporter n=1 Tax=Cellulomonas sp. PhB143 TaxID=2485186 RepID=UPI000F4667C7|nr:copper transporter [Cellulomonas sp. PhB143]ROS74297.1 copper transport outer membrane protein MctB [Cellulomonas sp. PhB143]
MIDFRYHIVSLISVFLALAVGIILGAGPLQGTLGEQLSGQVDQLRTERNDLRDQLNAGKATLDDADDFIEASGPELVAGSLEGRRVAVVGLGPLDDDWYDPIVAQLTSAGASVSGHVDLTADWTAEDAAKARDDVAGQLGKEMDVAGDADTSAVLSDALVTSLVDRGTTELEKRSATAVALQDSLVEAGLVTVTDEPTAPGDAVLVVVPPQSADAAGAKAAAGSSPSPEAVDTSAQTDIETELVVSAQKLSGGSVVAGPTATDGDLVSAVRDDKRTKSGTSTVSGIGASAGQISVPLAIAAELDDQTGQYGFEDSATAVIPPAVDLAPVTSGGSSAKPGASSGTKG